MVPVRFERLKKGQKIHLQMYDFCQEREIAAVLPGGVYTLTNGATIRPATRLFYHLPGQCPQPPTRAERPVAAPRLFEFQSASRPGVVYTVEVTEDGHLICSCPAGNYARDCKHKREIRRSLGGGAAATREPSARVASR